MSLVVLLANALKVPPLAMVTSSAVKSLLAVDRLKVKVVKGVVAVGSSL